MKFVIEHNNGIPGQRGFTEYSADQVARLGGPAALLASYETSGVFVYTTFQIEE
jgi:hypothetical protein